MNKVLGFIGAIVAVLSIIGFIGSFTISAEAAGEHKNAVYEGGVYASDGEDHGVAVFFYKEGKEKFVYINDGTSYVYSDYTITDAQIVGIGAARKLTAGALTLYEFEAKGNKFVMTEDGEIFASQELTAYEAQQVRDAF